MTESTEELKEPASAGQTLNQEDSRCECSGKAGIMCLHIVKGLSAYLLKLVILSLVLAYLFSIIDALRSYGVMPAVFPFTMLGQYQPQIDGANKSEFQAAFDNFLLWFNCAFTGGSRMGSGIGTLGASFWTLYILPKNCFSQRIVTGFLAGAVIGFRSLLMVSTSATLISGAAIVSAIFFAVYVAVKTGKKDIPPLPIVKSE